MLKATSLLLAGVILGGGIVYLFKAGDDGEGGASAGSGAAAVGDIETLDARLADAAQRDAPLVERAARDLGEADIDAALQALATIELPAARRAAAIALLDVVGNDAAGAERIAAALPASERPAFLAARLGRLAETDPQGAFGEMLGLRSNTLRRMAIERIAAAWAAQDAEGALAEARLLPEDLAVEFRRSVLTEWARLDAAAVLVYLETADPDSFEITGALSYLVADPEGVLAVAERRSDGLGRTMEVTALGVLAESDPEAALGRVEAMAPGPQRDQAVMMVGIYYAMVDPEAATGWVERMLPASPNARMLVAVGLAQEDPARALEMVGQGPPTQESQVLLGMIVQLAAQNPSQARPLAEELVARGDTRSRSLLANLISGWVQRDADGALSWALERDPPLDPALLGNAAASLAGRDAATAAAYLERIPARYRDVWITRMAGPYGRGNLEGALDWISQFRGQPVYDEAYPQLVMQAAQSNPRGAAELLAAAAPELQQSAAGTVATNWARQDTESAAEWAATLSDTGAREDALGRIVRLLSQRDAEGARALLERRVSDAESRQRIEELAGLGAAPP